MRKMLIAVLMLGAVYTYGQTEGMGIGVILGEPTGISGKYWLDQQKAVDFGLAYTLLKDEPGFSIHADLLFHSKDLFHVPWDINFYYGYGGRLRAGDSLKPGIGVRGVGGIVWYNKIDSFDIFFEIAPVFQLFPSTDLDFDIGIGGRYYFPIH
ncbi:MAG: hypothetical protein K9N07_09800 [Candidatus Cloacimonetes bacterium]|nr:hypothetical protein [Candidatus Cloacimonadota bacterium]